jgi:hypothetical protein
MDQGRLGVLTAQLRIKAGVEAEIVLDGVKAAAHPRGLDGIQEDPGEPHTGDEVQVPLPPGNGPRQEGKEIIDQGGFGHECTS